MLYTIEEVAQLFKISRSHAYRLKREQKWPHIRFGTEIRFSAEDIKAIQDLNRRVSAPPSKPRPQIGTKARKNK